MDFAHMLDMARFYIHPLNAIRAKAIRELGNKSLSFYFSTLVIYTDSMLQDNPSQHQEHLVYNDKALSDTPHFDDLLSSSSQNSTTVSTRAQLQTDAGPLISYGPNSGNKPPSDIQILDWTKDKVNKRRPRRCGPLKEGSLDEMKKLKTDGGACWRCKVLRKQV